MNLRRHNGFTLVELMAVILLVGLLMVMGMPALLSFRATAVSSGGRAVSNTLNLARQYAITQRTPTRVVFYYSGTTEDANEDDMKARRYNAYTIIAVTNKITVTAGQNWDQIGRWETLPKGAVFGDTTAPLGGALDRLDTGAITFTAFNSRRARTLAYIEFRPTGAAKPSHGGTMGMISVYEGTKDEAGKVRYSENENRIDIVFDGLIGRSRIVR